MAIFAKKDLLIQGTIEEFETIFEGKIVKKVIKTVRAMLSRGLLKTTI